MATALRPPGEIGVLPIDARDVRRRIGTTDALRGVTLCVRPGELRGLVGPDGAGKTTMIRALAGLTGISGGTVRILGTDPLTDPSVRDRMGVMPQHYSLYGDLTIGENLRFFGTLAGLRSSEFRARTERLLAITRLAPFVDRRADALSGGMYKKLALSCVLLHQPRVLLLDEPTNGVDPVSRRELWELLYEFVRDGMAIVLSTAYMDEAARCHTVTVLSEGRVLAEGDPGELVRCLEHPVYEVHGGDREELHVLLEGMEGILSASPAGATLRIVVEQARAGEVANRLAAAGASLSQVPPDFQDVFLARTVVASRRAAAARHEPSPEGSV